jgi:hypothetical protein
MIECLFFAHSFSRIEDKQLGDEVSKLRTEMAGNMIVYPAYLLGCLVPKSCLEGSVSVVQLIGQDSNCPEV